MVEHTGTDVTFKRVTFFRQAGIEMLSFRINAADLLALATVRRQSEDAESGVQRNMRPRKAKKYADDLLAGDPFVDAIIVNLAGDWLFDPETGELVGERSSSGELAEFEVLDGQHRVGALQIILDKEGEDTLRGFEFMVNALRDASLEQRSQVFLGQGARVGMDKSLIAALHHRQRQYRNDTERHVYELLDLLNTHEDSPLKGRIVFGDSIDVDGKRILNKGQFPVRSLSIQARSIFSKRRGSTCMLKPYSPEQRKGIVLRAFRAMADANRLFTKDGESGDTPLAMNTLLVFFAGFRQTLQRLLMESSNPANPEVTFSYEALLEAFGHTSRFYWQPRDTSKRNPWDVAERLDRFIVDRWDSSDS